MKQLILIKLLLIFFFNNFICVYKMHSCYPYLLLSYLPPIPLISSPSSEWSHCVTLLPLLLSQDSLNLVMAVCMTVFLTSH